MVCAHTREHKDPRKPSGNNGRRDQGQEAPPQGLLFLQQSHTTAGMEGTTFANITCFKCRRKGHYANRCPGINESGFNALQIHSDSNEDEHIHFMFTQVNLRNIPDTWVLLDSQSMVSIFRNKELLRGIHKVPDAMTLVTKGGILKSSMKGDIVNFGTVWYNENSIANILSLSEV